MQKFESWEASGSNFKPYSSTPEETKRRVRERDLAKRRRDFVSLASNFTDTDGTQICYGKLRHIANRMAASFRDDKLRIIFSQNIPIPTSWGKVCMLTYKEGTQVTGGVLWYQVGNNPKKTNHIFDVRPFFLQSLEKTVKLYGTDDAPTIMNQARTELAEVGLRAYQNRWFRNSSIADYLFHEMKVNLDRIPAVSHCLDPVPEIGSAACGYIPGPIHEYDMVSAYASSMLEFPQLGDFALTLNQARKDLDGKPTARVLKVTQSVLPGKFLSPKLPTFRPDLGTYIRGTTRSRLVSAMELAVADYGTVFRWNTDGFFTNVDISAQLDIGNDLGQWKHTVHDYLLLAQTNIFKTDSKVRDCGFNIDWDAVRDNPLEIKATIPNINWTTLEQKLVPKVLRFDGGYHNCQRDGYGCHDELHYKREAIDQCW
jgi:hypothetical protein